MFINSTYTPLCFFFFFFFTICIYLSYLLPSQYFIFLLNRISVSRDNDSQKTFHARIKSHFQSEKFSTLENNVLLLVRRNERICLDNKPITRQQINNHSNQVLSNSKNPLATSRRACTKIVHGGGDDGIAWESGAHTHACARTHANSRFVQGARFVAARVHACASELQRLHVGARYRARSHTRTIHTESTRFPSKETSFPAQ